MPVPVTIASPVNKDPNRVLSQQEWAKLKRTREFHRAVPQPHSTALGALKVRPHQIDFATQNPDEEVFIFMRRHWLTNIDWLVNSFLYMLLPIVVGLILNLLRIDFVMLLGTRLLVIILLTYYALIFSNMVRKLIDWYFNVYIVTNERVIDYDFKSATARQEVSEMDLVGVGDVKETMSGFLPQLFNYGDVSVFSEAVKNTITFHDIPDPTFVRDKVADLARVARNE